MLKLSSPIPQDLFSNRTFPKSQCLHPFYHRLRSLCLLLLDIAGVKRSAKEGVAAEGTYVRQAIKYLLSILICLSFVIQAREPPSKGERAAVVPILYVAIFAGM